MNKTSGTSDKWRAAAAIIMLATLAASALGGFVTAGSDDPWYAALSKPRLNPPDIAFAIVWPALFILMAVGAVMVRRAAGSFQAAKHPLGLFFTQLGVNAAWSWVFFGAQQIAAALGVIIVLWILIFLMIQSFSRHSMTAAMMQLPYLAWVTFAGYLNTFIMIAN